MFLCVCFYSVEMVRVPEAAGRVTRGKGEEEEEEKEGELRGGRQK